jgi:alkylated DNA nucleotide flippase Atl1
MNEQSLIIPDESLQGYVKWVKEHLLEAAKGSNVAITHSKHGVTRSTSLPEPLQKLLLEACEKLSQGHAVSITSIGAVLGTVAAARFLGIKHESLTVLLNDQKIPFHSDENSRAKVLLKDLIEYRKQRDQERHKALDEMTEMAQEQGLYDIKCPTVFS